MDDVVFTNEIKDSYKAPSLDWDIWSEDVEIRLTKLGRVVIGSIVGIGVTMFGLGLQSKMILNISKQNSVLAHSLNAIIMALNDKNITYNKVENINETESIKNDLINDNDDTDTERPII
jgi:hypothetical protein